MPNKTVHCKICRAPISGSTFKERMAKIRRHYKNHHPKAWAGAIKKAVATKAGEGNPKKRKGRRFRSRWQLSSREYRKCPICGQYIAGAGTKFQASNFFEHMRVEHPGAKIRSIKSRNPGTAVKVIQKAKEMFQKFHQFDPEKFVRVKIKSRQIPKQLVVLGQLVDIAYSSDKWHKGKKVNYIHKFQQRPYLAVSPGGDQLFIVGGKYKVKAEGIVG
jgi:hypothetical protein